MKAHIQIPKGWRRIPAADIRKGDRWLCTLGGFCWAKYQPQYGVVAYCVCTVIRRTKRPKKWVPKGWREISYRKWCKTPLHSHDDAFRYSGKGENELMTCSQWIARDDLNEYNSRFWLRRGAK